MNLCMDKKIYLTLIFCIVLMVPFTQITFQGFVNDTLVPYQKTTSGDVDNNGTDDLIIGTIEWDSSDFFPPETKRNIEIYLQSEEGEFRLHQIFRYDGQHDIETMDLADLNNDQKKELILGFSNKVVIYEQDNRHIFSPTSEHQVYSNVKYVSIADINHDSLSDIFVSDVAAQEFAILYQNKEGTFDHHQITPDINGVLREPEWADINHDGRTDIIYLSNVFWDAPFYVLLNDAQDGLTGKSVGILKDFRDITFNSYECGDVNSDGLTDIVATSGGNTGFEGVFKPTLHIFYQKTGGMLQFEHVAIDAFDIPSEIKITDLNGDKLKDIVTDHNGWQTLSIYEQTASGQFSMVNQLWNYPGSYTSDDSWTFGDFNHDCKTDLFIPAAASLLFYLNTTDFDCLVSTENDSQPNEKTFAHLYPNPVADHLTVSLAEMPILSTTFELYNSLGEWMYQVLLTEEINEVYTANLPHGVYTYIILENDRVLSYGRIVKL